MLSGKYVAARTSLAGRSLFCGHECPFWGPPPQHPCHLNIKFHGILQLVFQLANHNLCRQALTVVLERQDTDHKRVALILRKLAILQPSPGGAAGFTWRSERHYGVSNVNRWAITGRTITISELFAIKKEKNFPRHPIWSLFSNEPFVTLWKSNGNLHVPHPSDDRPRGTSNETRHPSSTFLRPSDRTAEEDK